MPRDSPLEVGQFLHDHTCSRGGEHTLADKLVRGKNLSEVNVQALCQKTVLPMEGWPCADLCSITEIPYSGSRLSGACHLVIRKVNTFYIFTV